MIQLVHIIIEFTREIDSETDSKKRRKEKTNSVVELPVVIRIIFSKKVLTII